MRSLFTIRQNGNASRVWRVEVKHDADETDDILRKFLVADFGEEWAKSWRLDLDKYERDADRAERQARINRAERDEKRRVAADAKKAARETKKWDLLWAKEDHFPDFTTVRDRAWMEPYHDDEFPADVMVAIDREYDLIPEMFGMLTIRDRYKHDGISPGN